MFVLCAYKEKRKSPSVFVLMFLCLIMIMLMLLAAQAAALAMMLPHEPTLQQTIGEGLSGRPVQVPNLYILRTVLFV
jgi:hypothetical protein